MEVIEAAMKDQYYHYHWVLERRKRYQFVLVYFSFLISQCEDWGRIKFVWFKEEI